jgi:hypothetical protein
LPAYSPDFSPIETQDLPAPTGSAHARSVAGSPLPGVTHSDDAGRA